jgi:hypothetical protein
VYIQERLFRQQPDTRRVRTKNRPQRRRMPLRAIPGFPRLQPSKRRSTSVVFAPPKPNELLITTSSSA